LKRQPTPVKRKLCEDSSEHFKNVVEAFLKRQLTKVRNEYRMKEKAGKKQLSKRYRQQRGWYLTCKLTLLLPSLAIGRLTL
jgi:hypothetical protein